MAVTCQVPSTDVVEITEGCGMAEIVIDAVQSPYNG